MNDSSERSRRSTDTAPSQSPVIELRTWLRDMARDNWNPDVGWLLLQLANRGRVRVCGVEDERPVFRVDLRKGDEVEALMRTVRRPLDVEVLRLCAKGELCFQTCRSRGHKDLRFRQLDVSTSGSYDWREKKPAANRAADRGGPG